MTLNTVAYLIFVLYITFVSVNGMLQPRESESRQIQYLDGMWDFRADQSSDRLQGFQEQWYLERLDETGPVIAMPVPSSFNDITTDRSLQNFVGWVWYDRTFFVPFEWKDKRLVIRVDSAHYNAIVWVNGKEVVHHGGGHLPFEANVNGVVTAGSENHITIAINNTLTPYTLPPGSLMFHTNDIRYPPGYFVQNIQFDFFNYAGIHRHVFLYTTPVNYIDDITVVTDISKSDGLVSYTILTKPHPSKTRRVDSANETFKNDMVKVQVIDSKGKIVATGSGSSGVLVVQDANLWWPYSMSMDSFGYRYTLKVMFENDVYRLPFGIRTVRSTDSQILINNKPFYCHGVGKHEDSDIRGKGLDLPLIARDFNMLKWLGVNCFRTSHYPYAEEIMEQADRQGIVVIDECPGVGIKTDANFANESLWHHLHVMTELIRRDKNRPSVIMWSVANEPSSEKKIAENYFKAVIDHTRKLDSTRLVTFVTNSEPAKDVAVKFVDVLCVNRYYSWYRDTGCLETIPYMLEADLKQWRSLYKVPFILSEYGADTVAGLHSIPSFVFTEEYQMDFLAQHHAVFDEYRKTFFAGEMVWNFADFMTSQTTSRVDGNKKGLLTRQRQPKMAAHLIRQRYWSIMNDTLRSP